MRKPLARHEQPLAMSQQEITISSRDYWFKIVGMFQQNWALVEPDERGSVVYFIHDGSGVFDQLTFDSPLKAAAALQRNGFSRYASDTHAQKFLSPPGPPFHEAAHPKGRIYSSGRFWR